MNHYPFPKKMTRRVFLASLVNVSTSIFFAGSLSVFAATDPGNQLSFYHLHTNETLKIDFTRQSSRTQQKINRFFRDFRTGEICPIDRKLLVILHAIQNLSGSKGTYEVISAYRSLSTNEMLRKGSSGIAKKSMHLAGRAIDVRLTDMKTRDLRDAACSLKKGGVGYYPASDFVHIDTGRVRFW